MQPLFEEARHLYNKQKKEVKETANKGLLFDRFYDGYDNKFLDTKTSDTDALRDLVGFCGDTLQLKAAAERRYNLVSSLQGEVGVFTTDWHFVTGMGNSHPAENGFSWHQTLGVPYLPGSSVKGLLRAWIEEWCKTESKDQLYAWFGRGADGKGDSGKAGELIFFDALPVEQPKVLLDIMTPHMGKWYEQGGEKITADSQPGDWHSPVPVSFLVVSEARFVFSIAPRSEIGKTYVKEAMDALKQALAWLGAGAKTAAGYGHMSYDEDDSFMRFKSDEEKEALRLEKSERETKARLEEAGIVSGNEQWKGAKIVGFDPSTGNVTLTYGSDRAIGKFGQYLSSAAKAKIKKKKVVYANAEVERLGNQVKIIALEEIGDET